MKLHALVEQTKQKILNGEYGDSGNEFTSVRGFCEQNKISLVTAFKLFNDLKEQGLITLKGKKHYLSYSQIKSNTRLGKSKIKSNVVGVYVSQFVNPFFAHLCDSLELALRQKGYDVIYVKNCEESIDISVKKALKTFETLNCDGVALLSVDPNLVEQYNRYPLPLVLLSDAFSQIKRPCIAVDNYKAGQLVAEKMLEEKFDKILLAIERDTVGTVKRDRARGFFDKLQANGVDITVNDVVELDYIKDCFDYIIKKYGIKEDERIGVFCYHDLLAKKLLDSCQKHNVKIPEKLGVIGFDNLKHDIILEEDKVSTIAYSVKQMGEIAAKRLIDEMDGIYDSEENYYISFFYIEKGTLHLTLKK